MEHLADELNTGWLVRVRFLKMHDESKGPVFKRCVGRSNYYCVPKAKSEPSSSEIAAETEEGLEGASYQVMTLSAIGEAETPAGGSVCIL